jgi:hypothetical protein
MKQAFFEGGASVVCAMRTGGQIQYHSRPHNPSEGLVYQHKIRAHICAAPLNHPAASLEIPGKSGAFWPFLCVSLLVFLYRFQYILMNEASAIYG